MAPVFRHYHHPLIWLTLGALAVALSAAAAWRGITALHGHNTSAAMAPSTHRPPIDALTATRLTLPDGVVFKTAPGTQRLEPAERLAGRFRLAGTFFMLSADMHPSTRKAVLVDEVSGIDHIVQEGDMLDHIEVVTVAHDHVVLQAGETREILGLGTGVGKRVSDDADALASALQDADDDASAASVNRFGEQFADNRWVFQRDNLLDYYQEVMRSPQRLKQVFDSMEPLYDDNRRITGYKLDIKGEPEFFEAVGLQQGDVVRQVNNMTMSSRRRAEYLIGEFIHDRLNVFILDIERGEKPEQLIYEIR